MKLPPGFDKIARQASPLVLGRVASAALTFVLPLWLARALDPAGFGAYKQLFLVVQTVGLTCQLGLTQSLYYFLPAGGTRRGAYFSQVMIGLALLSATAGVVLWSIGPWVGAHLGDGALAHLRLPLALTAATMLAGSPIEGALTSEGRVGAAAITYVVSDTTRAALLVGGALHGGIHGLAWAAVIYGCIRIVALVTLAATGVLPLARPSLEKARRQLAYALPFAGSVWLYVAQKQFAQYAVSARFDAATFALYAVALFHMPVVDILYTPITEVLMVRLGRERRRGVTAARAEWNDAVDKLASILWPATACAWLLGPTLLPMLFTHKYAASVPLFMLATIEIPLWVLPVDAVLRARDETRFLFVWNGARAALTAALVLGGIAAFGLAGAIVGGVLSEATSRAVMLARARRTLGTSLIGALDVAHLGRIAAATALAAPPAWAAIHLVVGKPGVVVAALAYGTSYLALRWLLAERHAAAPAVEVAEPALLPLAMSDRDTPTSIRTGCDAP